jgi:hypothetical protein
VKKLAILAAVALAVGRAAFAQTPSAQSPAAQPPAAPATTTPEQTAPGSEPAVAAGLSDLEKTTFACPRAALNAAAREVVTHPSQGTYQFSYFNIVSASHHAAYEVHFTSNYATEPVLKFCVSLYCQQGFDPATAKASVALIGTKAPTTKAPTTRAAGAGHVEHATNACIPPRKPVRRPTTR